MARTLARVVARARLAPRCARSGRAAHARAFRARRTCRTPSSGGLATVGVRAPRHPVALALIRAVGEPLAAPSANAHTHVSPTTAAHVVRSLGDRVDLVLDAGPVRARHRVDRGGRRERSAARAPRRARRASRRSAPSCPRSSTTRSRSRATPRVPRPGSRRSTTRRARASSSPTRARRSSRICRRLHARAHAASAPSCGARPRASGPRSRRLRPRVGRARARDRSALPADADGYAHGIFAALHDADEAALDALVIERVPESPAWWAVADRLRRAAEP